MNTDELLQELKLASDAVSRISLAVDSPGGITNNPDYTVIRDHVEALHWAADKLLGKIKYQVLKQRAKHKLR